MTALKGTSDVFLVTRIGIGEGCRRGCRFGRRRFLGLRNRCGLLRRGCLRRGVGGGFVGRWRHNESRARQIGLAIGWCEQSYRMHEPGIEPGLVASWPNQQIGFLRPINTLVTGGEALVDRASRDRVDPRRGCDLPRCQVDRVLISNLLGRKDQNYSGDKPKVEKCSAAGVLTVLSLELSHGTPRIHTGWAIASGLFNAKGTPRQASLP